jgi:hypothetical protein
MLAEMSFWNFINQHAIAICIVLSVIALLFIMFGHVYRDQVQSALKQEFVKLPSTTFDWWSISHAVLFGIFGFLVPNYHFSFFLAGTSFEILEDMLSSDATTQLADCMSPDKNSKIMCKLSVNDDYWYAKWDDVFVNLFGYTVGSSVRTTFF